MADGFLGNRDTAERPARSPTAHAAPPRPTLSPIIAPGFMVVSTQSGKAAIVTAIPSVHSGPQSSLVTDSRTYTISLAPATLPSTSPASTQTPSASPSSNPAGSTSHGLSTAKLAAVIVVPLVLLAILSPITIVWYISWRRKRRTAKRLSNRSSHQPRPLLQQHYESSASSRSHSGRASSKASPAKSKRANRIVSVPTPTFSSFNFELSRPASVGPIRTSTSRPICRPIPRNRRSATFSWGAPPPYASPTRTAFSSTPVPRLDTPDFGSPPLLETAQMVHIRPFSAQPPRLERNTSRLNSEAATTRSIASLAPSANPSRQDQYTDSMLQPPDPIRDRQGSANSTAESLHFRSSLQRPFSFQPLASPALSDISCLSFDPTLWASTTYGRDSMISPIDDQDEAEQMRPHQIV